jgi:hypothetical protein
LSASRWHACGLTVEGVAYCWGYDSYGQLGNGAALTAEQTSPSPVDTSGISGNKAFVALTAGNTHTCGLTADGVAYAGAATAAAARQRRRLHGQPRSDASGHVRHRRQSEIRGGSPPARVDMGARPMAWAIAGATTAKASWATAQPAGPRAPPDRCLDVDRHPAFVEFAADWIHMCGRTVEGVAYCWGSDMYGGLGNGAPTVNQASPPWLTSVLSGNTAFVQLSTGSLFRSRAADGVAYCWGQDSVVSSATARLRPQICRALLLWTHRGSEPYCAAAPRSLAVRSRARGA